MRQNQALARQRAGRTTFGPAIVYDSADLTEQVAHLGFDWVWLDWQHGQFTEHTLNNALARFLGVETAPIVRVKSHEPGTINRVLDMGAMGVIVPMVQDAAQATAAVQAAYYPPKGLRSAGGIRLGLIGGTEDEYCARANEEIMLIVMVETEAAVRNVRAIMTVPGVDVVLIGPFDLMLDVRSRGGGAAEHERLVEEVAAAARETGTAAGYVCGTAEIAERRIAQGFRFINYGLDHTLLLSGMREVRAQTLAWSSREA
jgi:2-keto-3-deoxy-L-rhamnonate aldolase RhmA